MRQLDNNFSILGGGNGLMVLRDDEGRNTVRIIGDHVGSEDFEGLIPEKSHSGRIFLRKATSAGDTPDKYFLVPSSTAFADCGGVDIPAYRLDCDEWVIIDLCQTTTRYVTLRVSDKQETIYIVISVEDGQLYFFNEVEELDAWMTERGMESCDLSGVPALSYDCNNHMYSFREDMWKSIVAN